jgi:hypothetical protein
MKEAKMADETTEGAEGSPFGQQELRRIAVHQKGVLACILVYLLCVGGRFVAPAGLGPYIMGVGLLTSLVGTVFVFLLSSTLYGTGLGVLLALLTLIPLVGLVILLVVNSKASGTLEDNGISVGLMGADLSEI